MSTKKQIILSAGFVAVAVVVVILATRGDAGPAADAESSGHDHAASGGGVAGNRAPVQLDAASAARIGVTYATVERRSVERIVRTFAVVTYDETRVEKVDPKVEGWVERLYVDFAGAPVRKGQPLLDLYSPQLVSAQEELILARRLVNEAGADLDGRAARRAQQLLDSARRRLAYWDISPDQIKQVETNETPNKTLTLHAPVSGVVVEKNVFAGARVGPGSTLYTIADLARVWVEGEVYEKDLSLVHDGQIAEVRLDAYPGETFPGTVTYVYPTVSLEARTGRVRVELPNLDGRLKPGMYARLTLEVPSTGPRIVVPRTAVHDTGERSFVFVRDAEWMLVAREVTTGLTFEDQVEILSGLEEGEVVVSSANFLIDAESSMGSAIGAMPGMEMEGAGQAPASDVPASTDHTGPGS